MKFANSQEFTESLPGMLIRQVSFHVLLFLKYPNHGLQESKALNSVFKRKNYQSDCFLHCDRSGRARALRVQLRSESSSHKPAEDTETHVALNYMNKRVTLPSMARVCDVHLCTVALDNITTFAVAYFTVGASRS